MNLHLALKTIWTVETDAGPLRLRLKHFKPKKNKPKRFHRLVYIYLHTKTSFTRQRGEREKKEEVVQLLGLTALNRSIMQTHSKVFIFGAHHKT